MTQSHNPEPAHVEELPRLTFEAIMEANDLPTRVHNIPEWGGSLLLRGATMAAIEGASARATVIVGRGKKSINRKKLIREMVKLCVVDPVLSAAQVEQLFEEKNGLILTSLISAIEDLCALTDGAQREAANEFRDESGEGDVVLPGTEDGSAAPSTSQEGSVG